MNQSLNQDLVQLVQEHVLINCTRKHQCLFTEVTEEILKCVTKWDLQQVSLARKGDRFSYPGHERLKSVPNRLCGAYCDHNFEWKYHSAVGYGSSIRAYPLSSIDGLVFGGVFKRNQERRVWTFM
jgi:hypothetical protein